MPSLIVRETLARRWLPEPRSRIYPGPLGRHSYPTASDIQIAGRLSYALVLSGSRRRPPP
jgi:hypothetical protein